MSHLEWTPMLMLYKILQELWARLGIMLITRIGYSSNIGNKMPQMYNSSFSQLCTRFSAGYNLYVHLPVSHRVSYNEETGYNMYNHPKCFERKGYSSFFEG
jgi:hypothetical protein